MKSAAVESQVRFVADAIEGKYPNMARASVTREVRSALARLDNAATFEELLGACRRIRGAEDDINNQVAALVAIRRFADAPEFQTAPLRLLHRIVYARDIRETGRRGARVADFPGEVPTSAAEAAARLSELEAAVAAMALAPVPSVQVAAPLLAHVFAAVIRIHAFEDGNGRVARFAVQFLLARWGMGLLPLPKVRNDARWKDALSRAVAGDLEALAAEFERRLEKGLGGT